MAALLAIRRQPIIVPTSQGPALVPNSGVAAPAPVAPLAALTDQTGAPAQALVDPNSSRVAPLADQAALAVALSAGQGGPARGGALIDQPRQPAPMESPDDMGEPALGQNGGFDVLKMLKGMGKAAGSSGGPDDASGGSGRSDGLLDRIKDLFLGPKTVDPTAAGPVDPNAGLTGATVPPVKPVQTGVLDPINEAADTSGALVDAPVPTARPGQPGDAGPGLLRVAAAQSEPGAGDPGFANSISPALAGQDLVDQGPGAVDGTMPDIRGKVAAEPNFLDKLRSNPLALTLLMGGMGTMAAASRRGATPLGALGEGMSGGLRTAFETQAAEKERELEERKADTQERREADEEILRGKQGAFYDARSAEQPVLAQARATTADAAKTSAGARQRSADASMIRADAYSKNGGPNGKGGKGASVFQQKQQAWLAVPGHENDLQGALDYAAGHKTMSGGDKYLSARRLATSQLNAMITPPDDPEKFLDDTTKTIMNQMDANDVARGNGTPGSKGKGGPALGGPAPKPDAAALHAQALAAIKKGADPAKVRDRYKKLSQQNPDF